MKYKITYIKSLTFIITFFFVIAFGYGQSDIIISQYIETTTGTTPKGVEIYNVSGADITFTALNNLQIFQGTNGGACNNLPGIIINTGTLLAGETWVIGTTNLITYANANGINISGTTDYNFAFNGNDALQLYLGGILQDEFGTCGVDPGVSWIGSGVETRNNNLQVENGICDGDIDGWMDPSERFNQIADGITMTGFGNAPTSCTSCASTVTWDGAVWSAAPGPTTAAIIDGNYNTATGNLNVCSLTVNYGFTLTIDNGDFVEVQNDIIVDGNITVETQGAVVQRGDDVAAGTYTNNGISTVFKTTAQFDSNISIYNYTYWSSPVTNANVITTFPNPIDNRRYYFQAENYLDATEEIGNNNATGIGQDDIDDNGNDWQFATTTMDVGRGYAVTAVSGPPMPGLYSDSADFIGEFNTGDVLISVYKNDSEAADNNWNLIGNPYPSAIDAQLFLTENALIAANPTAPMNGAIFLWSQGAAADANANGNQNLNFSQDDYAIINGVMGTAGGSGIDPNPYIPSGQGFFISYDHGASAIDFSVNSDVHTISRNEVRFTNSMRVTGNNGQFFRVVLPNKLWLNLTSDNGIFSQIGLGYVSGATNGYDGMYYDAPRNLSTDAAAILYTTIEGNTKKFAIQGKVENSLTEDEVIKVGFKTTIDVATLYTLSIAQFEGDFLNNNTIYLKDNMLNVLHDLSLNNYTFTSEVGEFNDRFEIVFNENALSLGENTINIDSLSIIELQNGNVQFKLFSPLEMESIEVIDLLGRTLYRLKANGNSKTYNLSNLSQTTYIAKVELSNGVVITKKAVKRY